MAPIFYDGIEYDCISDLLKYLDSEEHKHQANEDSFESENQKLTIDTRTNNNDRN